MAYSMPAGRRDLHVPGGPPRRPALPVGHQAARLGPSTRDGAGRLAVHTTTVVWLGAGRVLGIVSVRTRVQRGGQVLGGRPSHAPSAGHSRRTRRELSVEVAPGVALAARRVPGSLAVRGELIVDQGRHGLVGGGPVHVAAAEDGERRRPPRRRRGASAIHVAEPLGVVGRLPVVGGARRRPGRPRAAGRRRGRRAAPSVTAKPRSVASCAIRRGDALGGAEVGAEQHRQRRCRGGPRRRCQPGGGRGATAAAALPRAAATGLWCRCVRLGRGRSCDVQAARA